MLLIHTACRTGNVECPAIALTLDTQVHWGTKANMSAFKLKQNGTKKPQLITVSYCNR